MGIKELVIESHQNAVDHGWWEGERNFGEQIALMHSELSEVLEEFRNKRDYTEVYFTHKGESPCNPVHFENQINKECDQRKPEGIPIEFADVLIRIFDTCGKYGIDLEEAVKIKMEYNKHRPYRHGKKI